MSALPVRITLVSRGGITGGMRLPPVALETASLTPDAASSAATLVAAAVSDAGVAAPAPARRVPDAMSHQITVDYADRTVTLSGTDTDASPDFQALYDFVQEQARG